MLENPKFVNKIRSAGNAMDVDGVSASLIAIEVTEFWKRKTDELKQRMAELEDIPVDCQAGKLGHDRK